MRESKVETYMRRCAAENDTLYLKFISPANDGVPDRILIHNGKVTFVELKAPGKKPRKLQEKQIEKMRKHGAVVKIIDSIEGVDQYFLKQRSKDVELERQGLKPKKAAETGCKPLEHKLYDRDPRKKKETCTE